MKKSLLSLMGGVLMCISASAQEVVDVTHLITNAGFDNDLTFQADGTMKDAISTTTSLSTRSWAYIAADSTVYARPASTSSQSRPDGRKMEAVNGFKGRIMGWTLESNSEFPQCEWTYFGSVSYDLAEQVIPVADDHDEYLTVPARPTEFDGGEGFVYLRAGWTNSAVYKQVVKLPCAQYRLEYWTININPTATASAKDLTQIVCRKDVFKDEDGTGLNATEWTLHQFEFTPTSEFTMQFGYQAGNAGSGNNPIVALDGIKLYKIGEADESEVLLSDINDWVDVFNGELPEMCYGDNGQPFEGLVNEALNLSDQLYPTSEDVDALRTAIANYEAAYARIKEAIQAANIISNQLIGAERIANNTQYPGLSDFTNRIDAIRGLVYGEDGDSEAILAALNDVPEAISAYYMSQEATIENPANYSFLIQHPWFSVDGRQPFDNSITTITEAALTNYDVDATGWVDGTQSAGAVTKQFFTVGRTCYQLWNANSFTGYFDIHQELTGLPNGIYSVSADMITNANALGDQHIYATSSIGTTEGYMTEAGVLNDWVSGTYTDDIVDWETVTTTATVIVTDGKLTIGARSTSYGEDEDLSDGMRRGCFWVSNFVLHYHGEATAEQIAEATATYNQAIYDAGLASIEDGNTYRIFTTVDGIKYYLNSTGNLVSEAKKATAFTLNKVTTTNDLYPTSIKATGVAFTNPTLTNGSTGDVANSGHLNTNINLNRNDWEAQVYLLGESGKYKIRATAANSENWGANTYWAVVEGDYGLPQAGYVLADQAQFEWELESYVDSRPAAFSQVQTWAGKLQAIEGLVTEATQWSSNAKEPSEGTYEALTDGNYETFFHTSWSVAADAAHYLQAELPEAQNEFYIYFKKRSQNNNNRPTDILIQGSNDGETFTDITEITEGLPTGATPLDYTSSKIVAAEAYKYIRFTVLATNNNAAEGNGNEFFTFSEFYILPSNELTAAAAQYMSLADATDLADEDVELVNALATQIDAAYQVILDAEAIASTKAEILEVIAVGNEISQKAKQEDMFAQADVEANIAAITTLAEAQAGLAEVKQMLYDYLATIGDVAEDIDITKAFIVNPTPVTKDGWDGTNFGAVSNGVAEYWNQSAAEFHQTINLPAGSYKLTVVALQRTDMTGYVYAGDAQTVIAQATKAEANNRSMAAEWFAAGNGVNVVEFTMAEAGEITIGLRADDSTDDHWVVWQSFKLEMVVPVLLGDANCDGRVDILDVATIVNIILGNEEPSEEQWKNADVNGNGKINVVDLTSIVEIILDAPAASNGASYAPARHTYAETTDALTVYGSEIALTNGSEYVAFQMDVTLADGATLRDVNLADRAAGFAKAYRQIGANTYRIVVYSSDNTAFSGNDGVLFSLDILGEQTGVAITNAVFTDAVKAYSLGVNAIADGINGMSAGSQAVKAYDLNGRRVPNTKQRGIYILNGKTISVK